jgi:hypothetical protein
MSETAQTALVVLAPGSRPGVKPERANEVPPSPPIVQAVMSAFRDYGFELGPFIGISFAITGSKAAFQRVFSVDPHSLEAGSPELPTGRLPDEISQHIMAVTITEPPAFGPGNP